MIRLDDLFIALAREIIATMRIQREDQFSPRFCQQLFGKLHFFKLNQAIPGLTNLSLRKVVGHRTTDQYLVAEFEQVADHV